MSPRATACSCQQLRLGDCKLFVCQRTRLVQVGKLCDLVEIRRIGTGVCRRRRGVVGLLRLLLVVVLLLLVGLMLLAGVVSHGSCCRSGYEHPTAHTSTRNSHEAPPFPATYERGAAAAYSVSGDIRRSAVADHARDEAREREQPENGVVEHEEQHR